MSFLHNSGRLIYFDPTVPVPSFRHVFTTSSPSSRFEMADEDLIDYDEEEETTVKDAEGGASKK